MIAVEEEEEEREREEETALANEEKSEDEEEEEEDNPIVQVSSQLCEIPHIRNCEDIPTIPSIIFLAFSISSLDTP